MQPPVQVFDDLEVDDLEVLEYAKHDCADERDRRIRGKDAQSADERTRGHLKTLLRSMIPTTPKLAIGFMTKKSALLSVHRTVAAQHRCRRG
jgi:hypothetical protein